jgi:UDP-N-acetyl-D-glucosamine dehydrogenase
MTSAFSLHSETRSRIESRQARVAVVGLGYVGLPLALTVSESGFAATGLDLDAARVARINAGERVLSYFAEDRIARAVGEGRLAATTDAACLASADVILICVPTPLSADRRPDLSHVVRATRAIAAHLRPGQLVVLESTVWPGATATVLRPILEEGGLRAGDHFFLGFSPEREDPGNTAHTTRSIPKVVGADDPASLQLLRLFYEGIVERVVPVTSSATAEAVKLYENSFRMVNIAFANEAKVALEAMGVDVWEVVTAAATKPFGFMPFYPGPGVGGDCIPVSPVYLSARAAEVGAAMPLVERALQANADAPDLLADRIAAELGARGRPIAGARVLLVGVTYKKDVADTRESPALLLLERLEARGATVRYHDPHFPVMPATRDFPALAGRRSDPLSAEVLGEVDAVVVATDHSGTDYGPLAGASALVFDARNALGHAWGDRLGGRLVRI